MATPFETVREEIPLRPHILVAAEGGLGLRPLARCALKLATPGASLHLVAVTGDPRTLFSLASLGEQEGLDAHKAVLASGETALDTARRHLADIVAQMTTSVLDLSAQSQSAAEALGAIARREEASMIVVTAFGRPERRRSSWRIDPEEIAAASSCPVLYVPYECLEAGRTHMTKIMVGLDGSENAFEALSFVFERAPLDALIHVVYVVDHTLTLRHAPRITALMKDGMRTLARAQAMIKEYGRSGETTLIGTSLSARSVAEAIAHEAARWHADLVVLGNRGRTPLTRWLLGSVAERSLRTGKVPVLIVPARDDRAALREMNEELAADREVALDSNTVLPPIFL